jgi:tRNA dimethylallyltransferase
MLTNTRKPLVVAIMGPTASGKTAAALDIARHFPAEIISVDSALVYRGMNIGTAKPTETERAAVPHHLIDIIDPSESYSVMRFRQDALRSIADIVRQGKLPVMVGGTMLYFKALEEGLDLLPQADAALRARLDAQAASIGSAAMHARLAALDPITGARLKQNDAQRIQRALEVIELTGRPMSQLLTKTRKQHFPFEILPFALEPSDRSILHARIAARFDAMLSAPMGGLVDEVAALRSRGDLHLGLPSMRCVGYRQVWEYLDGVYDWQTMREKGIAATRQLAKRQITWLRSMPERQSIDSLGSDPARIILQRIERLYGNFPIVES